MRAPSLSELRFRTLTAFADCGPLHCAATQIRTALRTEVREASASLLLLLLLSCAARAQRSTRKSERCARAKATQGLKMLCGKARLCQCIEMCNEMNCAASSESSESNATHNSQHCCCCCCCCRCSNANTASLLQAPAPPSADAAKLTTPQAILATHQHHHYRQHHQLHYHHHKLQHKQYQLTDPQDPQHQTTEIPNPNTTGDDD